MEKNHNLTAKRSSSSDKKKELKLPVKRSAFHETQKELNLPIKRSSVYDTKNYIKLPDKRSASYEAQKNLELPIKRSASYSTPKSPNISIKRSAPSNIKRNIKLPLKRSVSYNIQETNSPFYLVSRIPVQYSKVKKSKDLLAINHKFPRSSKQDYYLFFLCQDPKDSAIFKKYLIKESISTTHNPSQKLNIEEIWSLYEKNFSFVSSLCSIADKTIKNNSYQNKETLIIKETKKITDLFNKLKKSAQKLIGGLYLNLLDALNLLEKSRKGSSYHIEDDIDAIITIFMFFLNWFFCVRLNLENICRYSEMISEFTPQCLRYLLENQLILLDKITKSCLIYLIIQITLTPDNFSSPEKISMFICTRRQTTKNKSIPFELEINNILKSKLMLEYFDSINIKNYRKVQDKIIKSTFLTELPDTILGLTLFNGYILLSWSRFSSIKNNKLQKGFILLCLIHEAGHYMMRNQYETDKQWIECLTPRELNEEAGNYLEIRLFGKKMEFMNIAACEYILNAKNWKKQEKEFRRGFKKINRDTDEKGHLLIDNSQVVRFRMSNTNNVYIGYCPKQNRNRNQFSTV